MTQNFLSNEPNIFIDLLQVLTKDLEKKEQAQGRVLKQLNDMQQVANTCQLEKDRLGSQLDAALAKLEDYKRFVNI